MKVRRSAKRCWKDPLQKEKKQTLATCSNFDKIYIVILIENNFDKEYVEHDLWNESFPYLNCKILFPNKISDDGNQGSVGKPLVNVSAYKQATGEAVYIDDIPRYEGNI